MYTDVVEWMVCAMYVGGQVKLEFCPYLVMGTANINIDNYMTCNYDHGCYMAIIKVFSTYVSPSVDFSIPKALQSHQQNPSA